MFKWFEKYKLERKRKAFIKAWRRLGVYRVRQYKKDNKFHYQVEQYRYEEYWYELDDIFDTLDEAKQHIRERRYNKARENRKEKWKTQSERIVWEHP